MNTQPAYISHRIPGRIRIKIPSKKKDSRFFSHIQGTLSGIKSVAGVEVNPVTGGILIIYQGNEADVIEEIKEKQLFNFSERTRKTPRRFRDRVFDGVKKANNNVRKVTAGQLDLWDAVFLYLLGYGIYQISRGNLKGPAWYSAFWYAFGVLYRARKNNN